MLRSSRSRLWTTLPAMGSPKTRTGKISVCSLTFFGSPIADRIWVVILLGLHRDNRK